ncbi:MAG: hypothetical protein AAB460_01480 [Patescibacteria group bacterium]
MSEREKQFDPSAKKEDGAESQESGASTSGDYIDWERFRQSPAYNKHVMIRLRALLHKTLLPIEELDSITAIDVEQSEDFNDEDARMEAIERAAEMYRTPESDRMSEEIGALHTVEDVKVFVREKDLAIDVDAVVQRIENEYPELEKMPQIRTDGIEPKSS